MLLKLKRIKNITNIYLRGSYSVEAALIVPVIIGMLFAMLYVLFFLHDKAVLYGNVNREIVFICEGEREYESDGKWREAMQGHLWVLKVCKGRLQDGKLSVSGYVEARGEWEIPLLKNFINPKIKINLKVKRLNVLPGEMLWGKKQLNDKGSD